MPDEKKVWPYEEMVNLKMANLKMADFDEELTSYKKTGKYNVWSYRSYPDHLKRNCLQLLLVNIKIYILLAGVFGVAHGFILCHNYFRRLPALGIKS